MRLSYSGNAAPTNLQAQMQQTDMTFSVLAISNWPDTSIGPFVLCINKGDPTKEEKLLASSYSGTTVQVLQRGYDNTPQQEHDAGSPVVHTIDKGTIDQANAVVNAVGTVAPSTSKVGDSASRGTVVSAPAAADHVHGRESFSTGTTSSSAPGDMENDGSSASPARADHKHAREPSQLGLPLALPGAIAATRYVGGTVSGAPTSGAFVRGDHVIDQTGAVWVCINSGSPGTWTRAIAPGTILAYNHIASPSYSTTSLSYVCVNSGTATLQFVAPPSGHVLLSAATNWNNGSTGPRAQVAWSNGTVNNTNIISSAAKTGSLDASLYTDLQMDAAGLTAGTTYTVALQWLVYNVAGTITANNNDLILKAVAL